jgi:hypothetical protein
MQFSAELAMRLWRSVAVAACLALTLFLLFPLTLYFPQLRQFAVAPGEIVPVLLAVALLCVVLIVLLLMLVPRAAHAYVLYLLFALSVLAWVEGNLLAWSYGPLNGEPLQAGALPSIFRVDVALWIIVFALAIPLAKGFARHAVGISAIFIAMQLVGVGVAASHAPAVPPAPASQVRSASFFEFSEQQNVRLIVLDSFQGDIFEEILQAHPEYNTALDGFTFYRDAVGAFSSTRPVLALLLTGEYYQNEQPLDAFLVDAYVRKSLGRRLKDKGFGVGIARSEGGVQIMYCDRRMADACVRLQELAARNPPPVQEASRLYDLALFRILPHAAKPWVYNEGKWRLSPALSGTYVPGIHGEDIRFVEIFSTRARMNAPGPGTFKFLHLFTPHPPFVMDEELRPAALKYSRPSCKQQCRGALRLVETILSTLKRIEAYDNTMILIVGDHGARRLMPVNVQLLGYGAPKPPRSPLQDIKSSALPLVLVKPFASRGPLRISKAPVSLGDVAKTIAAALGLEADFPGVSMLTLAEDAERERRFFHYQGFDWKVPFPTMTEYRVDGFSWLDESWHPTARTLAAGGANTNGSPGTH